MEEPMRNKTDRMETLRLFLRNNGFYVVLVIGLIVIGGAILLMALPETQEREAKAPAAARAAKAAQGGKGKARETPWNPWQPTAAAGVCAPWPFRRAGAPCDPSDRQQLGDRPKRA